MTPGKTYKCPKCGHLHPSKRTLENHKQNAHVKGGLPCPRCSCTFATVQARMPHMIRVHQLKYVMSNGVQTLERSAHSNAKVRAKGPSPVKELEHRNSHEAKSDGDVPSKTEEEIVVEATKIEFLSSSIPPSKKEIGPSIFLKNVIAYESDKQNTEKETWFKCKFCGFQCMQKPSLAVHYLERHDFKNLHCSICFVVCSTPESMEAHYKKKHRRDNICVNETDKSNAETSTISLSFDELKQSGIIIKEEIPFILTREPTPSNCHQDDPLVKKVVDCPTSTNLPL